MRESSAARRRRRVAVRCVVMAALLASVSVAPWSLARAETEIPSLREIAEGYGFSGEDVEKVLRGETVFSRLEVVSDNELALSAILLTKQDVDWHIERLEKNRSADPTLEGQALIGDDPLESLAGLELPAEELDRLGSAEAGEDFNFSKSELSTLASATSGIKETKSRRAATLSAVRQILGDRVNRYRQGGVAAIAPYDRGAGNESSPVGPLERAFGELRLTTRVAPHIIAAMASHPAPPPDGVTSRFLWSRNDAEGRMLVSLAHQVYGQEDGHAVAIDRRFYIHHTLNSMQKALVVAPVQEGTVVLYANRTTTDLVTGFGSGIARKIGSVLMRREIGRATDALLDQAE